MSRTRDDGIARYQHMDGKREVDILDDHDALSPVGDDRRREAVRLPEQRDNRNAANRRLAAAPTGRAAISPCRAPVRQPSVVVSGGLAECD